MGDAAPDVVPDATPDVTPDETPSDTKWYSGGDLSDEDVGYLQNRGLDEDPIKLYRSYRELEKFKGMDETKILTMPDEGDDEALSALHGRLGRPDDAAGYGTEVPDDGTVDLKFSEAFDGKAFDIGLTKKQNADLREWQMAYAAEVNETAVNELKMEQETQIEQLKKEWGTNYSEAEEIAKRAFRQFGVEGETSSELEGMLGSAGLMRLFKSIGDSLVGDSGVHPDTVSTGYAKTREQVAADKADLIAKIGSDRERREEYISGRRGPDVIAMEKLDDFLAVGAEPLR